MLQRLALSLSILVLLFPVLGPRPVSAMPSRGGPAFARTLSFASPVVAGFDAGRLDQAFAFVQQRVNRGVIPGGVLLVARNGKIAGWRAYGKIDRRGGVMRPDAIFDLESISKVVATAPAVLQLVEEGRIHLDDPVARYLPAFAANGKGSVTIRDMLRFTSGLDVDVAFQKPGTARATPAQRAAAWHLMLTQKPVYTPNSQVLYSDLDYRILGHLVERVTGMRLDQYVRTHIWNPLGMTSTHYFPTVPSRPLLDRVAGTKYSAVRHRYLRGEMADEQDWWLGGIVGCDGVFSDAYDLAVFDQTILNGGAYGGTRILQPATVAAMTRDQTPKVNRRRNSYIDGLLLGPKGYGWELSVDPRKSSGGHLFGPAAFGKSGGAGTFMWLDPRRQLIAVYLTNYGEPQPFTGAAWNKLERDIAPFHVFDLVAQAAL